MFPEELVVLDDGVGLQGILGRLLGVGFHGLAEPVPRSLGIPVSVQVHGGQRLAQSRSVQGAGVAGQARRIQKQA